MDSRTLHFAGLALRVAGIGMLMMVGAVSTAVAAAGPPSTEDGAADRERTPLEAPVAVDRDRRVLRPRKSDMHVSGAGPEAFVFGHVLSAQSGEPLSDVIVEARQDGARRTATVLTDESGGFEMTLPAGVFDLRALDLGGVFAASVERDLELVDQAVHIVAFELHTLDAVLRERGIDPATTIDSDGDALPDDVELAVALPRFSPDWNDDGVWDGVAAWVDADPWRGPVFTTGSPRLLRQHGSGNPIVLGDDYRDLPVALLFERVPGATGYHLQLFPMTSRKTGSPKNAEPRHEAWFDFEVNELIVGEGVVARFTPPRSLPEGTYRLVIQGYYQTPELAVGQPSSSDVRLVRGRRGSMDFTADTTISGLVRGRDIIVRSGVTVTVPAGEELRLVASRDIRIESGARIVGEKGEAGGSIELICGRDLDVAGIVRAGAGETGTDAPSEDRQVARGGRVVAGEGGTGGDLFVAVGGSLVITRTGRLASGDGGSGGEATASGSARGGDGGRGGLLVITSASMAVADRPERIVSGRGGDGGSARATGVAGTAFSGTKGGAAHPGVGGMAGDAWISDWNVRGDGLLFPGSPGFPIRGGVAGDSGLAKASGGGVAEGSARRAIPGSNSRAEAGSKGAAAGFAADRERRRRQAVVSARDGPAAAMRRRPAARAATSGVPGSRTWRSGSWSGSARKAGRAETLARSVGRAVLVTERGITAAVRLPTAAAADADTISCATSGVTAVPAVRRSRRVESVARASPNASRLPGRGGDAGDGGFASAHAGDGGAAGHLGGRGGVAEASAGGGGTGGSGLEPGRGGSGSKATSQKGDAGRSAIREAPDGTESARDGNEGPDGTECGGAGAPRT